MKIGIISDTHSKVDMAKIAIDMLVESGAEFIVHAGDVCRVETLELLKNCGKKYVVVYGNNDAHMVEYHQSYNLVQEPHYFKLADTTFKLMHLPFYMKPDVEIVISGHTHEFHCEFKNGTLFLNSGEVCARSKPISECAMLEVKEKNLTLTYYSRKIEKKSFKEQSFKFKREKEK